MILESFLDTEYVESFEEEGIDLPATFSHYFYYYKVVSIEDKQRFIALILKYNRRIFRRFSHP
jgi:hypothetical protein